MALLSFVLARLKEPSTYAGIGALVATSGIHVDSAVLQAGIQVIVSLAGLVAMLIPEKSA